MSLGKIPIILRKEYLERVKSKGFIISTALIPLVFASFIIIPLLVALLSGNSETKIAIDDRTGRLFAALEQELKKDSSRIKVAPFHLDNETERAAVLKGIEEGKLSGYMLLADDSGKVSVKYTTKNVINFELTQDLRRALKASANHAFLKSAGLDDEKIAAMANPIKFETEKISQGQTSNSSALGQFALTYVMVMLIYGTLITYGVLIMNSVIEEKSSKVMEVIISSVKPFELMLGKIIGIGCVALTQYLIWGAAFGVLSLYSTQFGARFSFDAPPMMIVWLVVYFILGYMIYATLYAAVGSAFESAQDAQALQTPLMLLIVIPMITLSYVVSQPDSTAAIILSLIPPFTPILMMARLGGTDVPLWQLLISVVLMIGTFFLALQLAAKIYRIGVLMYGKKPTAREIARWLRYS
jgi:ABC-2 type transport system permease protein